MAARTLQIRLGDRYTSSSGEVLMTGVQALVRLAINVRRSDEAHGRDTAVFISGYEGSPLAGYDLELERHSDILAGRDIVFRPAVNEELAATSVQGSQLAAGSDDARVRGITGFWYGKSPGLDRASDALRHANLMGTHPQGGAVVFVGDDPSAKSSTVPGASEYLLADLGMPVLYPADSQDVLDLGMHAVAMSRVSGLWVALKIVTNVADGIGTVQVATERVEPAVPEVVLHGKRFEHRLTARMLQPALSEMEKSREGVRMDAARAYAHANQLNKIEVFGDRARVGIVAAGKTYLDMRHALEIVGLDEEELRARGVRLMRLGMIHPLVPAQVEEFALGLDEVIVVEEKRPFIESAFKQVLYGVAGAPRITGKTGPGGEALLPVDGELDANLVATALAERLSDLSGFPTVDAWRRSRLGRRTVTHLPLAPRTPYFCSGCPHNSSTKVPPGSVVGGGIGCHALVLMMDPDAVGDVLGLTQMGGEGAQWIGMAPFMKTRRHLLQNIGDGTFHHSGSLSVRAAVASGLNITFKLLYNSAVAMTGGQRAAGGMSVPALTRSLAAEGVRRIIVTTDDVSRYKGVSLARITEVWHRDRLVGGAAGAECRRGCHRPDPRPGVRHRIAAEAEARPCGRPRRPDHDQRAGLRRMRRLRPEVKLPVGSAGRHRFRAQDGHRSVFLQQGLLVRRRRLPVFPRNTPAREHEGRSAARAFSRGGRHTRPRAEIRPEYLDPHDADHRRRRDGRRHPLADPGRGRPLRRPRGPVAGPDGPGPEGRSGRFRRQDQRFGDQPGQQGGRGRV